MEGVTVQPSPSRGIKSMFLFFFHVHVMYCTRVWAKAQCTPAAGCEMQQNARSSKSEARKCAVCTPYYPKRAHSFISGFQRFSDPLDGETYCSRSPPNFVIRVIMDVFVTRRVFEERLPVRLLVRGVRSSMLHDLPVQRWFVYREGFVRSRREKGGAPAICTDRRQQPVGFSDKTGRCLAHTDD